MKGNKYKLLTNISQVVLPGNVRTFTHALLIEDGASAPMVSRGLIVAAGLLLASERFTEVSRAG